MQRTYLRPLGLAYGPDAVRAVEQGRAGSLGGSNWISFSEAEFIKRDGEGISRQIVTFGDLRHNAALAAIEVAREAVAGLSLERPLVMGIVNVTPDSFSDGGIAVSKESAISHGLKLAEEGAHILDVGGESTRPGSEGVGNEEELSRVIPVITGLGKSGHAISCDTRKAEVMSAAVKAGAGIINDVSALQYDPESLATIAELNCPVVLMHAQGDPKTMQLAPAYGDVALDVYDELEARIGACVAAGISRQRIVIDPGIGFGKSFRHNLDLLQQLTLFHGLGVPLLVGLSRKGFIGALTGERVAGARGPGSIGGAIHAALNGAHILRVHDVKDTVAALAVALAMADPPASGL